ncbi:MAG: T9SS C-terminal target domain-containing protein [Flavobacteriales bacterium]|nr:MAG: T9SS C-terminal target domain-containing protein [Flavobacteriales bacterium]
MKKILYFSALIGLCLNAQAQQKKERFSERFEQNTIYGAENFVYSLQTLTGQTYTPITTTGAIDINNGQVWDDPDARIPNPFNFPILGVNVDSLDFDFGLGGVMIGINYTNPLLATAFIPMESDIIDRGYISGVSQSSIKYRIDGNSPDRILKIQWENCGSYDEMDENGTLNEFVNFQFWLHENGIIEHRYGPRSTTLTPDFWHFSMPGLMTGLINFNLMTGTESNVHLLSGPVNNPTLANTIFTSLTGMPNEGIVYRFVPEGLSSENMAANNTFKSIFPNPVRDEFETDPIFSNGTFTIIDLQAKVVQTGVLTNAKAKVSDLPKGIYIIRLEKNSAIHIQRMIKQ